MNRLSTWAATAVAVMGTSVFAAEPMKLDLDRALALAREHSLTLQDRRDELRAAGHRKAQAKSRFLPQVGFTGRYARLSYVEPATIDIPLRLPNQPPPEPIQLGEAIEDQVLLRLEVQQPLFTGFALSNGYAAASHAERAASERARMAALDLEVQVEEAYLSAVQASWLQKVTTESVEVLDKHLGRMEKLLEAGAATPLDVAQAKSRAAAAKLGKVRADAAAELSRAALATFLGLDPGTPLELADPAPMQPPPAVELDRLTSEALQRRPELAAARAGADAKRAQVAVSGAAMWPQVALRAGYNYDKPNQRYFPPENEFHESWDAGVVVQWNVFDWGVTYHGREAAKAEAAVAARAVTDLEEKIRLDVLRRRRDTQTAVQREEAAAASVAAAALALDRAQVLCASGQASCNRVLDAEAELTRARSERVQASIDLRLANAQLRRATGGEPR